MNTAALPTQALPLAQPGLLDGLRCVFSRDLRIALRRKSDSLTALVFFVLVVSLFPLAVGPEPALLRTIAPGVVWVAALLACTLPLSRLFADDHADGTLEQLLIAPHPLALLVAGKVAAQWVASVLPLVLVSPLLALQFDLGAGETLVLVGSLLLGSPVLILIGALGAALTLGLRGASVLMSLLVLPLLVPVLIFGAGAVSSWSAGLGVAGHFSLLGAMLLVCLVAAPGVIAAALRISME